jgi:outer membrane protein insertion porin family
MMKPSASDRCPWASAIAVLFALLLSVATASAAVVRIEVRGNDTVPAETIIARSALKVGEPLDADRASRTIRELFSLGYFENVSVDSVAEGDGEVAVILVTEFPTAASVEVSGNSALKSDELLTAFPVRRGEFLSPELVEKGRRTIVDRYQAKGYYKITVDPTTESTRKGKAALTYRVTEGGKVRVSSISFPGLAKHQPDDLLAVMMTKEKNFLSFLTDRGNVIPGALDDDAGRIQELLLDEGYVRARVGKPELAVDPDGETAALVIAVDEGEVYTLASVGFGDTYGVSPDELGKALVEKAGDAFSRKRLRQDIQALTAVYNRLGYAFARVSPQVMVDDVAKTVQITFHPYPDLKTTIRRIEIVGNTKTRDWVVRRELSLSEGGLFDVEELQKSQRRIINIGAFDDLAIIPARAADGEMELTVKVHEKPTGTFSLGIAYSSVDYLVGQLQFTESNFLGRGQTLQLSAEYGGALTDYTFEFREPYFFGTSFSAGFSLYNTKREYANYTRRRVGGSLSVGRRITEDLSGRFTVSTEHLEIFDVDEAASKSVRDQEGTTLTNSLKLTLAYDSRDNFADPTRGNRQSVTVEYAGGFLGGDNWFTRYNAQTSWYFPFLDPLVLVLNGRGGYVVPYGDKTLPIDERFFVGGINSVRGFDNRKVGPKDETGDPLGGDRMLVLNAEIIIPIAKEQSVKGVLFFDAGNVFAEGDDLDLSGLRTSAGAGIRWYTPMGPLRLEWGRNLNPKDGEEASQWHFSIGAFF